MPSIESLGYPLVFSVSERSDARAHPAHPTPARDADGRITVHADVHALDGMQKEALVRVGSGRTWRMVSDEGPYLNGADMAPFPLAFFAAGMQFSFLSEFVRSARAQSVALTSVELVQETFYSMEGSFLRGDATGGAMPVRMEAVVESEAEPEVVAGLMRAASARSGPQALMRDVITNLFALTHNRVRCEVDDLAPSASAHTEAPNFDGVEPDPGHAVSDDIITKTRQAEKVHGVEGGAGSSLQAEQKRTLHIHGEARMTEGGGMETDIRLFKPIGSSFRFQCDETAANGGAERAPSPLAYLAAGVGFCYMTQLGRYAHIRKKDLAAYSLTQENGFVFSAPVDATAREAPANEPAFATAHPFDTHVFIESEETDEVAGDFMRTGARTCFLHAAMRDRLPSDIRLRLNGSDFPL